MLLRDSSLVDRLFDVVDRDKDDFIVFADYIYCLSLLSNKASNESKIKRKWMMNDDEKPYLTHFLFLQFHSKYTIAMGMGSYLRPIFQHLCRTRLRSVG